MKPDFNEDILTLGRLLKTERERLKISLEKAASILMVRKIHLINLENDIYDYFPEGVYFRGFLRNYARLLGLDENKIFEYYECQLEIMEGKKKINDDINKGDKAQPDSGRFNFILTPDILLKLFSVVILLVIIYFFVRVVTGISKVPKLVIESPMDNQIVFDRNLLVVGHTNPDSNLKINNEEIPLTESGSFEEEVILMRGVNEINISVKNKFARELHEKLYVNYKPKEGEEDFQNKEIVLKTDSKPVWIMISQNGEQSSQTIPANSEKSIKLESEIKIRAKKANDLYFFKKNKLNKDQDPRLEIFSEQEEAERVFSP
ncbi:MAG: hypothetical protein GF347_03160 [Candidatus Moranbacteria bacterium]|nr:hypothetical protein [Candidatus Moranbacteria bacterium]